MVVKVNFHVVKNHVFFPCDAQTSVLATRAQITLSFDWLVFTVKVTRHKKFYCECQPINTCARVASTEVYACHREKIDFYHHEN